jgi:hypothetical protein
MDILTDSVMLFNKNKAKRTKIPRRPFIGEIITLGDK